MLAMRQLAQIQITPPQGLVFNNYNTAPADLFSRVMLFAIAAGGLIFFVQLIMAGFNLLTAAGDPAKIQSATKALTNSLTGLILVISTYFIAQIIEAIFGLQIL